MKVKKTILFLLFFLIYQSYPNAQSRLVFKPGLSFSTGFNHIIDDQNADPSFASPRPIALVFWNGRLEYIFDSLYIPDLTVKRSEVACSYIYGLPPTGTFVDNIDIRTVQVNFAVNRQFKRTARIFIKRSKGTLFLKPKIGLGAGVTFNASEEHYLSEHHEVFMSNLSTSQNLYISRVYTAEPENHIGYNILARAGFSILKNKKELLDFFLEYNKGLTNLTNFDVRYYVNTQYYSALLGSRGTNINATIGLPITLIRFK